MTTTKAAKNRLNGNGGEEKPPAQVALTIKPPRLETVEFTITGDAPYVQHAFSSEQREKMHETQAAGSGVSKNRRAKPPKDFEALYRGAMHVSTEGWHGIPAAAFRAAMISACRIGGFVMSKAKLSVFVVADGFSKLDGTGLVRIIRGEPRAVEHSVRNSSGVTDLRVRPMWDPGWQAVVRVRFDRDQFTTIDVANLLMRAGMQVGVGEGRPDSRQSTGMGWGTFTIDAQPPVDES